MFMTLHDAHVNQLRFEQLWFKQFWFRQSFIFGLTIWLHKTDFKTNIYDSSSHTFFDNWLTHVHQSRFCCCSVFHAVVIRAVNPPQSFLQKCWCGDFFAVFRQSTIQCHFSKIVDTRKNKRYWSNCFPEWCKIFLKVCKTRKDKKREKSRKHIHDFDMVFLFIFQMSMRTTIMYIFCDLRK
jgi:hypothetical protein